MAFGHMKVRSERVRLFERLAETLLFDIHVVGAKVDDHIIGPNRPNQFSRICTGIVVPLD
jgi:hypothetical protein